MFDQLNDEFLLVEHFRKQHAEFVGALIVGSELVVDQLHRQLACAVEADQEIAGHRVVEAGNEVQAGRHER